MELPEIIADIRQNMGMLEKELDKSTEVTAAARRARKITIGLGKLFKDFRKASCAKGLK